MDALAVAVVAVVGVSLVALLAMARSRAWNADGSDDRRRGQATAADPDSSDA